MRIDVFCGGAVDDVCFCICVCVFVSISIRTHIYICCIWYVPFFWDVVRCITLIDLHTGDHKLPLQELPIIACNGAYGQAQALGICDVLSLVLLLTKMLLGIWLKFIGVHSSDTNSRFRHLYEVSNFTASERLVILGKDLKELRDYGILLYHCGLYGPSFTYLCSYKVCVQLQWLIWNG